jgi:hypothetical protein
MRCPQYGLRLSTSCTIMARPSNPRRMSVADVVRTHQFALAKRHGDWDVVETAGHKQAKAEIKRLNEELEQRVVERTSQLTLASEALRSAQAELAPELDHVRRLCAHRVCSRENVGAFSGGRPTRRWPGANR